MAVSKTNETTSANRRDLGDLLRRIRRLELISRQNASSFLRGEYRTAVLGNGWVFHESRKYVHGESARKIDWNITARVGEPHVRVHQEERQREVIVALDVSPSMHARFGYRSKLELGVELAATLALAAIEGGDRLGYVLFADRVLAQERPRQGPAQLFRTLRALLEHVEPWTREVRVSDPRAAVHAIERSARGRFTVFLISDFIDHDLPDDLRYLRARHDVSLLHVYDPFEYEPAPEIAFSGRPSEGPDPRDRATAFGVSPASTGGLDEIDAFLRRRCGEQRLGYGSFSTEDPVGPSLGRFFHRRSRRSRR